MHRPGFKYSIIMITLGGLVVGCTSDDSANDATTREVTAGVEIVDERTLPAAGDLAPSEAGRVVDETQVAGLRAGMSTMEVNRAGMPESAGATAGMAADIGGHTDIPEAGEQMTYAGRPTTNDATGGRAQLGGVGMHDTAGMSGTTGGAIGGATGGAIGGATQTSAPSMGGNMAGSPNTAGQAMSDIVHGGVVAGIPHAAGELTGDSPEGGSPSPMGGDAGSNSESGGQHGAGGVILARLAVVDLDGSGDYRDLQSALAAGETNIIVRAGRYEVDTAIIFDRPGVSVRGESRETVVFAQTNDGNDLFVVRADDVTVEEVTLDTSVTGQAAFVEANANRVTLQDSIIRGGANVFTIFFAGPAVEQGDETLNA